MTAAAVLLAALFVSPAHAAKAYRVENGRAVETTPADGQVGTSVDYLDRESDGLRDAAANLTLSEDHLYARAQALWGRIPGEDTTGIGPVTLRGWEKPKIHTAEYQAREERETINIDGISQEVRNRILQSEVPEPEVLEAYRYGEALKSSQMKTYDEDGQLGGGVLGVYKYTRDSAIGIFLNQMMRRVQAWAGNEFAAATDLHENAHARDHNKGHLNPVEVKKGEKLAYKTEFLWLQMMDPKGEKLSWARATIGKFATGPAKAPQFVGEYLEHLAMIRRFGEVGDYDGLVTALGYRDRSGSPWANAERVGEAEHAGHEHGSDGECHANRMVSDAAPAAPAGRNILPVHFVDFPANAVVSRGHGRD